MDKNLYRPASDSPVSIYIDYTAYPGEFGLWIYNTAGEHIQTLVPPVNLAGPINKSYFWDGTNKRGDACASGVYILYLVEPFDRKLKKILLVR